MIEWEDVYKELDALDQRDRDEISLTVQIASAIIERRTQLGWSQAELAQRAGLKQPAIARIEQNGVIPRLDTLEKILKALGLEIKLVNREEACAIG